MQAFAEGSAWPGFAYVSTEQQRRTLEEIQSMATARPDVDEQWIVVDGGPTGSVKVRVIRPAGVDGVLPGILFLHGGGWTIGNASTHDRLARELCVGANAALVFPEYDLAPEAQYPVALEQCWQVAAWMSAHGRELNIDAGRIAVAGDQMGGNLAAALAILSTQRDGVEFECQVLLNPCTDASFDTDSYRTFAEGYVIRAESYIRFWDQYVPDAARRGEITASPLRATSRQLEGLPPACVITAEADCLRDEGEAYAEKMRRAGVPVLSVRYSGVTNGFMVVDAMRDAMAARGATAQAANFLKAHLHSSD